MKKLLTLLFALLIACSLFVPTMAAAVEPDVMPLWDNTVTTSIQFGVNSSGNAYVDVTYVGNSNFARADLTIQIEKHHLGVFWLPVLIEGVEIWTTSSTADHDGFYITTPVDGEGLYQATIVLKITGTDGSVDVIKETMEYEYAG